MLDGIGWRKVTESSDSDITLYDRCLFSATLHSLLTPCTVFAMSVPDAGDDVARKAFSLREYVRDFQEAVSSIGTYSRVSICIYALSFQTEPIRSDDLNRSDPYPFEPN